MAFKLELPDIGEGVVEAEVQRWFVKPGDEVAEDQPLVEVMTDKATVVIPSPRSGRVLRLFRKVGELAKVHEPLVELDTGSPLSPGTGETRSDPAAKPPPSWGPPGASPKKALATPAVRAMAREMGVAIDAVAGTGPGGRVTKDDLAAARGRKNGHAPAAADATPAPTPAPRPSPPRGGEGGLAAGAPAEERVPLRGLRRRMAENMARSKRTAAHFTFVDQCDATELVRAKERIAEAAREEGVKVTYLPFVLKAAVAALRKHPRLNATMDEERGELVVHRRYDLGVASATEAGLVVPVVRGVDRLSLLDLARELERLGAATKAGQVRPEDLGRSTFTVTSLGALGGLFATPVLNHPEVAILGVHRIRPTPVARDGQVVIRDVMHVSVTCDHRVVDGYEAAAYATEVIRHLENPELLFMRMA
jgi:pyruvate dehydrogenase E2 component (dihydrolipoamide acetyltransferase)